MNKVDFQGGVGDQKNQGGMVNLLLAAALCSLMAFVAFSYSSDSLGRKEAVQNNFESAHAELNLAEAIHQFRAFFETIDTSNFTNIKAPFKTGCVQNTPNYQTVAGFAPAIAPNRTKDGMLVNAIIGSKADPCAPPTPEDWKVYFKAEGNYDCAGEKASTCARRTQLGELDYQRKSICNQQLSGGGQVCTTETKTCDTSSWNYSFKKCSQMAYEWKLFNKGDGGRGTPFSGLAFKKSLSDADIETLWKAPVTVTGDVINATPVGQMESEGLKTAINVSFSENALFFGKELPPYGYFQPVEIGGQVIGRPQSPKTAGVAPTTDVYLNVFGVAPQGNGRLSTNNSSFQLSLPAKRAGKTLENYNWFGSVDPTDPSFDGVPTNPAASMALRSQGSLTNSGFNSLNSDVVANPDRPLGYFTGRKTDNWKEVMRYNFPGSGDMNTLWKIEKAQENLASVISNNSFSGGNDDEKAALRKMATAYYYFNAKGKIPTTPMTVMGKAGSLVNKNLIVGSGAGYYSDNSSVDSLPTDPANRGLARKFVLCGEKYPNSATWDFERTTGNLDLSCTDPVETFNPSRFNQLTSARRAYYDGLAQIANWQGQISAWQGQINDANNQIANYNNQVSSFNSQIATAQSNNNTALVNQLTAQRDAYISNNQANLIQWNNIISQANTNINNTNPLIQNKTQTINSDWATFMDGPGGYRQDYVAGLTNATYLSYVTQMRLIGTPKRASLASYPGTNGWIGDYLNNPINKSGSGCLNDNKLPCTSNDFSYPQAMGDNAVILIDARGSGVYLKNLRYVSAQLIVVLGDLYAEDVVLNSNLIVLGDLYLVGRGLAVAPRRWWGVPLQRQCTADLNTGVWDSRSSLTRRTVNTLKFPGAFDPRFLGNVQLDACVSVNTGGGGSSSCQVTTCEQIPPTLTCSGSDTILSKSRMSVSSRYFQR